MEAIDMWDVSHRRRVEESYRAVQADPDLPHLEAKAATKGYRRPTLNEILYLGPEDLYTWCGILWVKQEPISGEQLKLFA